MRKIIVLLILVLPLKLWAQNTDTLLARFKKGELNPKETEQLISQLKADHDSQASKLVIDKYVKGYLLKQPDTVILKKDGLLLIFDYLTDASYDEKGSIVNDKAYLFVKSHTDQINRITDGGFTDRLINNVILGSTVQPVLWQDRAFKVRVSDHPDWTHLENLITQRFGKEYTDKMVLMAKKVIYQQTQQWDRLIAITAEEIDKNGLDTTSLFGTVGVNNFCYNIILKYSDDKSVLKKAAGWMHRIIAASHDQNIVQGWMDTEANLLYKSGEKEQALDIESRASDLATKDAQKRNIKPDPTYEITLNKMRSNEPTWTDIP